MLLPALVLGLSGCNAFGTGEGHYGTYLDEAELILENSSVDLELVGTCARLIAAPDNPWVIAIAFRDPVSDETTTGVWWLTDLDERPSITVESLDDTAHSYTSWPKGDRKIGTEEGIRGCAIGETDPPPPASTYPDDSEMG
ncbi:hypothetical protein GCM10025875_10830 [Litorihabitans aurantiacus]|uniref:Uncharacterized protein n=1 Tax=Litorihabitans aurantiacus TaxID=1930061 RepID=A0AA37UQA8_9MICO|nr:hypothetical protein GCM10025875_10830 [Litorihabitans aurantiacus]